MTKNRLLLWVLCVLLTFSSYGQLQSDEIFDNSILHEIRIEFDEEDYWDILLYNYESVMGGKKSAPKNLTSKEEILTHLKTQYNAKSESKIDYLAGKIIFDGDEVDNVGVRLKGFSSYWGSEFKKSIKLDFNEFVDTQVYKGIKKINLNNGEGDPSFQRDFISYHMMREAGVAAPRVSYAKVFINDKYWGLYTMVEQVDKTFLQNNFASGTGNLYKAIGWSELEYINNNFNSYHESIELKTNEETSDGSDYVNFVKSLQQLNGSAFSDSIQKLLYIDYYFKVLAIDIISKNWDSYMMHGRNFYLYHEPVSDLFYWIPWDYNLAWDGMFNWGGSEWDNPCDTNYTFTYDTVGSAINYKLEANLEELQYIDISFNEDWKNWWDFSGDDTTIVITDSTAIIYDTLQVDGLGIYTVHLNLGYEECGVYKSVKIVTVDSADIKCNSIYSMNRQYGLDDVIFDEVFKRDNFCCDCQWDAMCENMYFAYPDTVIGSWDYPIDFETEKHLIRKIFKTAEYKDRYFDEFKFILDSVFDDEKLINLMISNTNLIREAVYADTNLIFTVDDFENDIDAVCDKSHQITSFTRLLEKRKKGLDTEYSRLNYQAQSIDRKVDFNDVVINEFMASRSETDTTYKADWIELYNNTENIINLDGFWLSDKKDTLKYKFPSSSVIKPDGYVIVWADKSNKKNGLHAGFKLSAGGEDILLYHEKYDTIDVTDYQYVNEDSVLARIPNGTGSFVLMYPTFNKNNESARPVGIEKENNAISLIAYPNPANTMLYLKAADFNNYTVEVFDTMGKLVHSKNDFGKEININVSLIPNGFYILKVKHGKHNYSSKIAIKH